MKTARVLGEPPVVGTWAQPLGCAAIAFRVCSPATARVYTMAAMGVFERHALANGIRVLTAPMPHAQSVSCFVMLAAGSRYETAETNGIAHFAEHMFFKGTERRPTARDIAGEIDAIGGEFNAFTGKEYTGYYVKCAAETRDTALDVLVDMLRHSTLRPRGDRAREGRDRRGDEHVLRHAARLHRRRLRGAALRRPAARLGHHRPQGDRPRRDARDVPRLPRPLVPARADGRRGRRADRRRPAASGSRSCSATSSRARRARPTRVAAGERRRAVNVHTKASDQAHLVLGVPSLPLGHPDRYALQLLATVLGGGMSSRLFTEVRERRGLAYYVFGVNHSYTDAGSLYAQAGVDIKRIDEAVTTIVAQLRRIADEPVPPTSSRRRATSPRAASCSSSRARTGRSCSGSGARCSRAEAEEPQDVLAGLDAVTAEDIQRVAQD